MATPHPPLHAAPVDANAVTRVETEALGPPSESPGAARAELHGGTPDAVRVGRFSILNRLGRGGMGVVYSAYDDELDRRVAIKVLCEPDGGDDCGADRMRREAQALARVSHPNVVQIFEVGTLDDRLFIAMEYIKGETLGAWIRGAERDWGQILDVFLQAGRGLAAAHRAGIIHRDFKPDNVMVGVDGRVRVLDFGLARGDGTGCDLLDRATIRPHRLHRDDLLDLSITCTGVVMGTPAYMPPEQFQGHRTTPKTDQFSFCVSLYEALYGERPFDGDSRETLAEATTGGHLRPIPPGRAVPRWLRDVVLRGLSPDPADRWPSMGELLGALRQRRARRRMGWLAAALGGLAALVGLSPAVESPPELNAAADVPPGWLHGA